MEGFMEINSGHMEIAKYNKILFNY